MTRKERIKVRNRKVREAFKQIQSKNPKWRFTAVVNDVAAMFFISTRTVEAILRGEGVYSE